MARTTARQQTAEQRGPQQVSRRQKLIALLKTWELYPIILLAAFLRLARLDAVVFGVDEGHMYLMARDFITHGFIPLTSNRASMGSLFCPLFMYFLLIPASISANPMLAMGLIGLINTLAVIFTYFFTRRYFGRVAAAIAALFFATSPISLIFSNGIWQPNLMAPLTLLFMSCLFTGIYRRRKGWLFPAIVLLGVLFQIHGTAIYLTPTLLLACVFAYQSIRARDLFYAGLVLLLMLAPFILLEFTTGFTDLRILYQTARLPSHTDWSVLNDIKAFLGPYVGSVVERGASLPTHPNSILYTTPLNHLVRPLEIIHALLPWLFIASLATAILTALLPQPRHRPVQTHETSWGKEAEGASGQPQGPRPASPHPLPLQIRNTFPSRCRGSALDEPVHHSGTPSPVRDWLLDLWGTSHSQALLLLVMWEGIIPLLMVRHAIPVYLHYYTFLLPGQFILIGIFLQRVTELVRGHLPRFTLPANIIVAASAALLIGAQTVSSTQTLIDTVKGNFNAQAIDLHFYNLAGLQTALDKADRLAQTRHIHRIYIATSYSNDAALRYLAQQLKTPVTLFDGSHCLILPASSAGPVVFLETPYLRMVEPTITHYATATLVDSPWRPGGDPFMLYILTASNTPAPQSTPGSELRPLDQHASLYSADTPRERWLVTRWQILQDAPPLPETTYIHTLDTKLEGTKPLDEISCAATRHWSGDQLFALQRLQPGTTLPSFITVQPTSHTSHMQLQHLGPLTFSIFNWIDTPTRYDRPLKMLTLSVLYETASPLIADSYTSRSFGTVS